MRRRERTRRGTGREKERIKRGWHFVQAFGICFTAFLPQVDEPDEDILLLRTALGEDLSFEDPVWVFPKEVGVLCEGGVAAALAEPAAIDQAGLAVVGDGALRVVLLAEREFGVELGGGRS